MAAGNAKVDFLAQAHATRERAATVATTTQLGSEDTVAQVA